MNKGIALFSRFASTQVNPAVTELSRFWKSVDLGKADKGYTILLDGRCLKSPSGTIVTVPKEHHVLALLAAAEWEGQDKVLKSYTLPVTSIIVRALDSLSDEEIKKGVIDNMMKYIDTDSICYHQEYPESLEKLQDKHWKPIIKWIESTYDLKINTCFGIVRIKQEKRTHEKFREIIQGYDLIKLAAFEKVVLRTKSFMIALALMEDHISVDEATSSARLEVMHQIEKWGEVEDAHDVDREEMRKQLGAARCALIKE